MNKQKNDKKVIVARFEKDPYNFTEAQMEASKKRREELRKKKKNTN